MPARALTALTRPRALTALTRPRAVLLLALLALAAFAAANFIPPPPR